MEQFKRTCVFGMMKMRSERFGNCEEIGSGKGRAGGG